MAQHRIYCIATHFLLQSIYTSRVILPTNADYYLLLIALLSSRKIYKSAVLRKAKYLDCNLYTYTIHLVTKDTSYLLYNWHLQHLQYLFISLSLSSQVSASMQFTQLFSLIFVAGSLFITATAAPANLYERNDPHHPTGLGRDSSVNGDYWVDEADEGNANNGGDPFEPPREVERPRPATPPRPRPAGTGGATGQAGRDNPPVFRPGAGS